MIVLMRLLALAGLLAPSAVDRPAGHCRAPRLTILASSSRPKQGGLVAVSVTSDQPLARAALSSGGDEIALERSADGRVFRGLLGVDLDGAIGPRKIRVSGEDRCGRVHRSARALRVVSGHFPIQRLEVEPAYVEPPESELDRIREDKEKVERVWEGGDPVRRWAGPFRLPVEAPLRDNFGSRRVLNGEKRSPHSGVDLAAAAGAPVAAPAPGRVALADELYFSGGTVILDHGAGLFTTYFHLSRMDVKAGDLLDAGAPIGAVGATGRATGPHLHWGARLHRARINPLGLLHLPQWPHASAMTTH